MRSSRWLLWIFLALVLVKTLLSFFVASPTIFGDEYEYAKLAWSIFHHGELRVNNMPASTYPPLYPLALSPAYVFRDMELVYFIMKIINALLSSAIVFPMFFLLRELFKERTARYGALLTGLAPFSFATAPYIMSENLFAPLFLASVYFLFMSFLHRKKHHVILAGAFIGLTVLTRVIGLVLLIGIAAGALASARGTKWRNLITGSWIGLIAGLIIAPWIIWTYVAQSKTVVSLFTSTIVAQNYSYGLIRSLIYFLVWCAMHLSYLFFASGGVLGLYFLHRPADDHERQRLLYWIILVMIAAVVAVLSKRALNLGIKELTMISEFPGRIIGRYLDFLLPLVITGGFLGFNSARKRLSKMFIAAATAVVALGSFLFYYPLLPFNNLSLSLLGAFKTGLAYMFTKEIAVDYVTPLAFGILVLLAVGSTWIILYLMRRGVLTMRGIFLFTGLFFVASSTVSYAASIYNSQQWNTDEQLSLGRVVNQFNNGRLLVDERYCGARVTRNDPESLCTRGGRLTFAGFWTTREVLVSSVENARTGDYIVTRDLLHEQLLRETEHGIRLYKR